jgi:P27 family predicted phage terminase small subunit
MPAGRPPTPTPLKRLQGTRASRINDAEPQPSGEAEPPAWLEDAALALWNRLAPDMIRQGVLRPWDAEAFARYCQAEARAAHANAQIDLTGGPVLTEPVVSRDGKRLGEKLVQNQWWRLWIAACKEADVLAGRFGCTPSDRTKLRSTPEQPETPAAAYLTG